MLEQEYKEMRKRKWAKAVAYHPPQNDEQRQAHEQINQATKELGDFLIDVCPPSDEQEHALNHIMLARMFANAARAIHVNARSDEAQKTEAVD